RPGAGRRCLRLPGRRCARKLNRNFTVIRGTMAPSVRGRAVMRRPGLMILLGAGLALAGCSENFRGPHPYNADLQAQVVPAVYCYSNLTHSPDCYDVPIEPEVRRLMG